MFDRVLDTPLDLHDLFAFIFVWDFDIHKTAIPLQSNVSLRHLLNALYISFKIEKNSA